MYILNTSGKITILLLLLTCYFLFHIIMMLIASMKYILIASFLQSKITTRNHLKCMFSGKKKYTEVVGLLQVVTFGAFEKLPLVDHI